MLMQVHEKGDRIYIELQGIAGRQQSVLRALTQCRLAAAQNDPLTAADVTVRANTNAMRICLQGRPELPMEAVALYRSFRDALMAAPVPAAG